ncbi:NACHT domain-containing protein [Pseudomonas congelans]|uniref:NACHT domain-containing protein n=1 Tax=Pseudomonas congelans TaxID=200452 RepID=UPI0005161B31|nr:ATP-binding protein [Pseudomonas congelans]
MEQFKLEKIRALKHEVNDFHPVLRTLFTNLPDVSRVEYKQGPHEMGADFVLEKNDSILDEKTYIGVIVKVGKILQNHSEIERQISECSIPRYFHGGKSNIHITEIWIITNENITNNAQIKINNTYKTQNIKFIDQDKIVKLLDKYYPDFWENTNKHLADYVKSVHNQIATSIKNTALIDGTRFYIDQRLAKISNKYSNKHNARRETYSIESVIAAESCLLIEGSMGTGKSSLINRVMESMASEDAIRIDNRIPILISFSDFIDTYEKSLSNIISEVCELAKISQADHSFIVAMDAVDEIELDSADRINYLTVAAQCARDTGVKLICVSRGVDNPEEASALAKQFSRYRILPFTLGQVIALIEKVCQGVSLKSRIESDLRNSSLFKVLPRTPIAAILLAKLLNEDSKEIPSTMTELYAKYTEVVLGRWDNISKGLESQKEYEVIENSAIEIAMFVIDNNLQKISLSEAKGFFEAYIKTRNLKLNAEDLFKKFISKKEISIINERTNSFQFKHRTFAEFFYAKGMAKYNTATIDEKIYNAYWTTTYFFFIGLKRDCPELVDAINNIEIKTELHRLMRIVNNGNYLLAAYLTPYNYIQQGVAKSYADAARYLTETFNGTITSALSKLTKMHILYLITRCLNDSFRYDYFKEALSDTALQISYVTNPSEEEFLQLFLLRNTCLELGEETAFDQMLEVYEESIPLYLQFAIRHESGGGKPSPLIAKFIKRLAKQVRSSGSARAIISKLYYVPIAEQLKTKSTIDKHSALPITVQGRK